MITYQGVCLQRERKEPQALLGTKPKCVFSDDRQITQNHNQQTPAVASIDSRLYPVEIGNLVLSVDIK